MTDLHHLPTANAVWHFDKASRFSHPDDVLADPELTVPEKRSLLASWVSDVNTVPHVPSLRQLPDGSVVKAGDILRALKTLDEGGDMAAADRSQSSLQWRLPFERRRVWVFKKGSRRGRGPDDDDPPPSPAYAMLRPRGGGGAAGAYAEPMPA